MKYEKIIELLTTEQKISLLTDKKAYLNRAIIGKGVPKVTFTELFAGENAPTQAELANTFDGDVVYDLAKKSLAGVKGGVVILPDANVRTITGGAGFSEDPALNSMFIEACARAASERGATPCARMMCVRKEDSLIVDDVPEKRPMVEYLYKAFKSLGKFDRFGIIGDDDVFLFSAPLGLKEKAINFASGLNGKQAVLSFKSGSVMCFDAREALEEAVNYYGVLKKEEDNSALAEACLNGEAVSEEMLDKYVSRAISFAFDCKDENELLDAATAYDFTDDTALDAAVKSVVLLENKVNTLPIKEKINVAIIGEAPESLHQAILKYKPDALCVKTDENMTAREILSKVHDTGIFVVSVKGENGELKKSEAALLSGLMNGYGKVVCVLPADWQGDADIADKCHALLLAPSFGRAAEAVADILCGVRCPSGRLPVAMYNKKQKALDDLASFKNLKANRVGEFVGYRRYIEDGDMPRYPFGYGLSYAKLEYSRMQAYENKVTFYIKNESKLDAEEIVQLYVGRPSSAIIRPMRELCFVRRVTVKAGARLRVEAEIPRGAFENYCESLDAWMSEDGAWRIYVCRSSAKVALSEFIYREGNTMPPENRKRYQYLLSESNIKSDFYVSDYESVKSANPIFRIGLILLGILLIIGITNIGRAISYSDEKTLLVGLLLVLISIPLYIVCLVKIISRRVARRRVAAQSDSRILSNLSSSNADKLFRAAFADKTKDNGENEDGKSSSGEEYTYEAESKDSGYVEGVDVNSVIDRLTAFCAENGVFITKEECASFIAAMATSRLVVMKHSDRLLPFFNALKSALSGELFFDFSPLKDGNGLVFSDKDSINRPTEDALRTSNMQGDGFTFLAINYPDVADDNFIRPFYDYFNAPHGAKNITFEFNDKVKTLPVSAGLWVFLLIDGRSVDTLPEQLLSFASYVDCELNACESKKFDGNDFSLTYRQFERTVADLSGELTIDENNWKKIDKFADYMTKFVGHKLGNREYTTMEKYFSVMLLAFKERTEVVDRGVASLLLPTYLSALSVAENRPEESLKNVLERIFGEDNMPISERMTMDVGRNSAADDSPSATDSQGELSDTDPWSAGADNEPDLPVDGEEAEE